MTKGYLAPLHFNRYLQTSTKPYRTNSGHTHAHTSPSELYVRKHAKPLCGPGIQMYVDRHNDDFANLF